MLERAELPDRATQQSGEATRRSDEPGARVAQTVSPPARGGPGRPFARYLTRRRFLAGLAGAGAAAAGSLGYAIEIEPTWLRFNRHPMPVPDLGLDLVGLRIIQISDLHVGKHVPMAFLKKWVDWVTAQQADLIVVTGDMVHRSQPAYTDQAAQLVARLKAREGVLAVMGNHDWGTSHLGGGNEWLADRVAAALAAQKVRLLRNESVAVRRGRAKLHIVGLEDYWGKRFDPDAAFAHVPTSAPCIALSHNPDTFIELLDRSAAWILSGHTHGGQVNLPLVGPLFVPVRHKQFVAGAYQIGEHHLYVNRGLGWLIRIRFNARPEITEFTLQRA